MSGKKSKKNKGTTMSLQEFSSQIDSGKTSASHNIIYTVQKTEMSSWADEVEENNDFLIEKLALPTAPRSARGPNVDESEIPREPPFTAHLGNLSYEIGDDDIYRLFRDLEIVSLILPKDSSTNRLRGFGYVDFATREQLIEALCMNDVSLRGRPVRVNLQGPNHQGRSGGDMRRGGDRGDRGGFPSDETPDDWRSSMKSTNEGDYSQYGGPPSQGYRGRERDGPRRNDMYGGGFDRMDRGSMERGLDRMDRGSMDRGMDRGSMGMDRGSMDRGMDRSGMGRPPRPDYGHDREGGRRDYDRGYPRAAPSYEEDEGPSDWRSNMRPKEEYQRPVEPPFARRPPPEERRNRQDPPLESPPVAEPPKERKKLVIAPRTVPLPPGEMAVAPSASAIFGEAKPVDTAAKEREIEEKLAALDVTAKPESSDKDASGEPQEGASGPPYRMILKRNSSERNLDKDSENLSGSNSALTKRSSQPVLPPRIPLDSSSEDMPGNIQILRPERERTVSTCSFSGNRGVSDPTSFPYPTNSHQRQNFNVPHQRSFPSRMNVREGSSSSRYASNTSSGASSFHRRKSDSDSGEHEDPRNTRRDRQQSAASSDNTWGRRRDPNFRGRHEATAGDRKTPDSDRNADKEKDSHSEPEDDRDSHRFVGENSYQREDSFRRGDRSREYHTGRDRDGAPPKGDWNGPRRGDGGMRRSDGPRRGGGNYPDDHQRRGRYDPDNRDPRNMRENRRGGSGQTGGDGYYRSDRSGPRQNERGHDGYDRNSRGGMNTNRRPGGPQGMDKGSRPNRSFSREDYQRDSDGFETRMGRGGDRPPPKHVEEKRVIDTSVNKFGALQTEDI